MASCLHTHDPHLTNNFIWHWVNLFEACSTDKGVQLQTDQQLHVYLPLPLPFPATFRRAAALANISLSESSSPSLSDSDGGGTRGEDITGAIDTDGVIICTWGPMPLGLARTVRDIAELRPPGRGTVPVLPFCTLRSSNTCNDQDTKDGQ